MSDAKEMKKVVMLTKENILDANDLPIQEVSVPEWNGSVRLKTMSGKERDVFEGIIQKQKKGQLIDLTGLKAMLLSLTIIDEAGFLLFSEADLEKLNGKSSKAINDLFEIATEMNGIGEEAVEELRKN